MRPAAALEHLVGLQAQLPGSPYQALHARLARFDPLALSGLLERRDVVRMVLIRGTIHLVTADDAARLRPVVQPVLDRELFANRSWAPGVEGVDLDPVLALGRELTDERPRSLAELRTEIAARWPDLDAGSLAYSIRNLLPTVQATPRGLWGRSGGVALTTLERWTGRPMGEASTIDEVIPRYLRSPSGPLRSRTRRRGRGSLGCANRSSGCARPCARSATSAGASCSTCRKCPC